MKGLKTIVKQSKSIITRDRSTWMPLYYSITDDTVSTTEKPGYILITRLISENSEADIKAIINQFLCS